MKLPSAPPERTRTFLVAAGALLCLASIPTATIAAETTIGLYSDPGGFSCSFTGDANGIVTAYVVVKPGDDGVRGVRFAAPIPSCFHATFLGDTAPDGVNAIGNSQTGISLSWQSCGTTPFHVLEIQFLNNGGTEACCAFPIIADPFTGLLEAVACDFSTTPIAGETSRFNADPTCECGGTFPPPQLTYQGPINGSVNQPLSLVLSWLSVDPSGQSLTADVYFGTDPDPPLVASDFPVGPLTAYQPGPLAFSTTYYWKVVLRNEASVETAGPTWSFTTRPNAAPVVTLLAPADNATGLNLSTMLSWSATDAEGQVIAFDVYIGTDPNPPLAAVWLLDRHYAPPLAYATTYWWRIVARDSEGAEGTSVIRTFTTKLANEPPNSPTSPNPSNGAINQSQSLTLTWQCTDPEGQAIRYDVYFGSANPPPQVVGDHPLKSYSVSNLLLGTVYRWRIVARDSGGLTTSGSTWSFTTRPNLPPAAPAGPSPTNGAINRPINTTLSWNNSVDPEGQAVSYDVYFGAADPPPLVATNVSTNAFDPGAQSFLTTYRWRVVARDTYGATTSSVTWSYTTKPESLAPTTPSVPYPPSAAIGVPHVLDLRWSSTDPEGQPLTYEVYFGSPTNPALYVPNLTTNTLNVGPLQLSTTYGWRVVAHDMTGLETSSPVWTFTTSSSLNLPPAVPSNPTPVDGDPNVPASTTLQWSSQDPDGDPVTYYVEYGPPGNPQQFFETTTSPFLEVGPLTPGLTYSWRVMATDGNWNLVTGPVWTFHVPDGTTTVPTPDLVLALHQNVPNPFNPQTTIRYEIATPDHVRLAIYDASGRRIRQLVDESQTTGSREVVWNGRDEAGQAVSSGVYFYVLDAGGQRLTRKLVLLK